jgi:tetratricopeptide (TPR) repeat protein
VLAARIDHLPPVQKHLLQTAAVIGTEVAVPLLQAIAELPAEAVSQGLGHLQAAEFLYETRLFPEWVYTFKHALTHEVAYRSLLHERQRALHSRIVVVLETLYHARLAEQVERLAHHALQGEVWDKALFYYRQAGDRAMARSAFREAVACFEQALTALRHLPEQRHTHEQAIDLRYDLGNALQALGEFDRRFAHLREAETLAEALGDQRRLGQICANMTHSFWTMGDYDNALTCGQRALTLAAATGDAGQQARVHGYLGTIYFSLGDYRRAIDVFRQAIQFHEGALRHERFRSMMITSARDRCWLLQCYIEVGAFVEGLACGEEAAQIAATAGHLTSTVMTHDRLGLLAFRQGELSQAIVRLEHALTQCRAADIPLYLPAIMATLGLAYMRSGQVTEALPLLDQVEVRQTTGGGGDRIMLHLGEGYLLAGRVEDAHRLAARLLARARDQKERGNQAWALRLLGEIALQRHPPEVAQAEAYYQQALALADGLGMRPLVAHCHFGLGRLYTRIGRRAEAGAALSAAVELYGAMAMTFWLPQADAALAEVGSEAAANPTLCGDQQEA